MDNEDQTKHDSDPKYDCLIFDLDDTLYPLSSGLAIEVAKNIQEYMIKKLGIEESKASDLCFSLYKSYGTTMAGLKAVGYEFDSDDFHSFVHGRLPYDILNPDPALRSLLLSLPTRKVIFTNADKAHAAKVLSKLDIEDCFEMTICFETLNHTETKKSDDSVNEDTTKQDRTESAPHDDGELHKEPVILCKPLEKAFQQTFEIANINAQKTVFFDDSIRNLQTGKAMGLHTVWVGASQKIDDVDWPLENIHDMKEALPELWT
ncbi:hypothetical protein ACFE04_015514 [Oxalis oulophora]